VNNLIVNSKLAPIIIDDKNTNTTAPIIEALSKTSQQLALIKHRKTLLDIASLSHSHNTAIIADVQDTVLLEDRAKHVLDNDGRARVADEAGLLVQLLGEQVDTEVAVLACLGGGGDADDLAGTALQDKQVADPDVVAGDGDGVGNHFAVGSVAGSATLFGFVRAERVTGLSLADGDVFLELLDAFVGVGVLVVGRVVVVAAVNGVQDLVGSAVETVTEAVVLAVFVVISHVPLGLAVGVGGGLAYTDLFVELDGFTLWVALGWVVAWLGAFLLPLAGLSVILLGERSCAGTEVSLVDVKAGVVVNLGSWGVTGVVLAVLDVELGFGVALVRLAVPVGRAVSTSANTMKCDGSARDGYKTPIANKLQENINGKKVRLVV
jgi:hypothetical protein